MKKKLLKIITTVFICLLMLSSLVFATYIPTDISPSLTAPGSGDIKAMVTKVLGALMWIGYAVGIGMIIFVGIKYLIASADEKASLKGALVKVVVGSIIVIASSSIVNVVINLSKDV